MSCNKERHETIEEEEAAESATQESTAWCPCGHCPKNAKWVCMAGLAAGLGFAVFRALRHTAASS